MSEEELLKPRYKVIAKHSPFNTDLDKLYPIGFIIDVEANLQGKTFLTKTILEYPHLFKKLEWWQDRKLEDLPKYVINKSAIPKVIIPVTWVLEEDTHSFKYEKQLFAIYHGKYYPYGLLPATEQEYTDYINSLTK